MPDVMRRALTLALALNLPITLTHNPDPNPSQVPGPTSVTLDAPSAGALCVQLRLTPLLCAVVS